MPDGVRWRGIRYDPRRVRVARQRVPGGVGEGEGLRDVADLEDHVGLGVGAEPEMLSRPRPALRTNGGDRARAGARRGPPEGSA